VSKPTTIARPYAKAILSLAIETETLIEWQKKLELANLILENEQFSQSLFDKSRPFVSVCRELMDETGSNLIRILAENDRLPVLPEILLQFRLMYDKFKKVREVDIISATPLNSSQVEKIRKKLEKKFSCQINISTKIEQTIIAGIVICSGDTVIDGSLKNRLNRLKKSLYK
jgi:F-type H+-transporting ATPase subunit delta